MALLRLPPLTFQALPGYRLSSLRTIQPTDVPFPANPDRVLRCAVCAAERGLDESAYVFKQTLSVRNPFPSPRSFWAEEMLNSLSVEMLNSLSAAVYVGNFDRVLSKNDPAAPFEPTKEWGLCAEHVSGAVADINATKEDD